MTDVVLTLDSFTQDGTLTVHCDKHKLYTMFWPCCSSFAWTMLLSMLYGITVILVGVAFPITEALRHEWLTSQTVAVSMHIS